MWLLYALAFRTSEYAAVALEEATIDECQFADDAAAQVWEPMRDSLAAWLLGCALLMPVLALIAGFLGFVVAGIAQARRRRER